jgi:hypothetical protein
LCRCLLLLLLLLLAFDGCCWPAPRAGRAPHCAARSHTRVGEKSIWMVTKEDNAYTHNA